MRVLILPAQITDDRRRGAAMVELAVCLPLILLLFFGAVESCDMIFLDQTLSVAAYEGARTGVRPFATTAEVQAVCQSILASRNVVSPTIVITPADVSTLTGGQILQIAISAPFDSNNIAPPWLFPGRVISTQVTMVKE